MIDWLMQRTADGSTYLQVIILTILLVVVVGVCVRTWNKILEDFKEGGTNDKH